MQNSKPSDDLCKQGAAISAHSERKLLHLHVKTQAKKTAFAGEYGSRLKVDVAAPATDDRANQELITFLAKHFAVPKKNVQIIRGCKSRDKTVLVARN